MRLRRLSIIGLCFLMLSAVSPVSAREVLQQETCEIAADETISGSLYVFCQTLIIDGIVENNLIGASVTTVINGEVGGGIYLVGGQFDLHGGIRDNLHYLGAVLNIHGDAHFTGQDTDLFSVTMSTLLDEDIRLPGSILGLGYQQLLRGDVDGEVSFWGAALEVSGTILGDVTVDVGDAENQEGTAQLESLFIPLPVELDLVAPGLRLRPTGAIEGQLRYTSPSVARIDGDLSLPPIYTPATFQTTINLEDEVLVRQQIRRYFGSALREFTTLGIVGALGLAFFPDLTQAPISNLRRRPLTSLGVGTLTFILSFPVFLIFAVVSVLILFVISLLQVTDLVIAGGVILGTLDIGGASLFYFISIFFARSVVCLAIGRVLLRFVVDDDDSMRYLYASLAVGALAVGLVVSLPMIGWLVNAFTLFIGLGAIVNLLQAQLRVLRETGRFGPNAYATRPSPRLGSRQGAIESRPRPVIPAPQRPPGTEDLPPGFEWWEDA